MCLLVVGNFYSDKCNVGVLRGSVEGVNVLAKLGKKGKLKKTVKVEGGGG